eukprot:TRINITY_DN2530_c0_g2_i1.p1 TRINITY_DN2530_c0_g2~~TRINITY_DN2530_c0_g2_i1.p1  ORF type:complete len:595 (-),score=144.20 TRINITY_DN2530_c0_g2_i1:119-1903(-)
MQFQKSLVQGDRKVIYPILYFLLSQFHKHKKRAYLAQYLVSIAVPSHYLVDEEMNGVHQKYKELQAEFQAAIQHVDQQRTESASPKELQKKISQLEQEKEQLVAKITILKKKNAAKPEFQELVEATSLLRKEQEEGSRLYEKTMEQKAQLDWYDQQLLMTKQRLIDVKKMAAQNTSPEKMLEMLRVDVKKNRDLCNEILGRELTEKLKRLQQIEFILTEPTVTQSELEKLILEVKRLQRETLTLEDKAKRMNEGTEDKLAIYKSQANAAAKKRERAQAELHKLEEEERALEKVLDQKEKEYTQQKGTKFMKHDDFKRYAADLRSKQAQYKKMRGIIEEIKAELTVLLKTEKVLRTRSDEIIVQMKAIEVQTGAIGFYGLEEGLQQISTKHEEININKGQTLAELTGKSADLKKLIESRKSQLDPLLKPLNALKEQCKTLEAKYNEQKQRYDATLFKLDNEKSGLQNDVEKLEVEYLKHESKYHSLGIQAQLTEAAQSRAANELLFKTSADKRLSTQYKCYTDQLKAKVAELEAVLKEAKGQQRSVREMAELNSKQVAMFGTLKKLLEVKLRTMNVAAGEGLQEKGAEEYNRLVL